MVKGDAVKIIAGDEIFNSLYLYLP